MTLIQFICNWLPIWIVVGIMCSAIILILGIIKEGLVDVFVGDALAIAGISIFGFISLIPLLIAIVSWKKFVALLSIRLFK